MPNFLFIMTFEQLLIKYFYEHKIINLPGIGVLEFTGNIPDNAELEKNRNIPIEGLSFKYDANTKAEEQFIDFFAEQKGKMKSLAHADVDSHFQLVKQFLNIGKSYEINGLGVINKKDNGDYDFKHGNFTTIAVDNTPTLATTLKERSTGDEKFGEDKPSITGGMRKALIISLIGLLVLAGGWLVYKYLLTKPVESITTQQTGANTINTDTANTVLDTPVANNSVQNVTAIGDSLQLKAMIRNYTTLPQVLRSYARISLASKNAILDTSVAGAYKIYLPIKAIAADTLRIKDSLRVYYAFPVQLAKQ